MNTDYVRATLNEFLDSLVSAHAYDPGTGTLQLGDDFICSVTLPETYSIPAECIEFVNAGLPATIKSYASPLCVRINQPQCFTNLEPLSWWRLTSMNFPDWILFMDEGEDSDSNFYLNCNPQSSRYGQILHYTNITHWNRALQVQPTIFSDIYKFMEDVRRWVQHVNECDTLAIRDASVQYFLDSQYGNDSEGVTNRIMLNSPETSLSTIDGLIDDIIDTLMYPDTCDIYPYEDIGGTFASISSWLWDGLHL